MPETVMSVCQISESVDREEGVRIKRVFLRWESITESRDSTWLRELLKNRVDLVAVTFPWNGKGNGEERLAPDMEGRAGRCKRQLFNTGNVHKQDLVRA